MKLLSQLKNYPIVRIKLDDYQNFYSYMESKYPMEEKDKLYFVYDSTLYALYYVKDDRYGTNFLIRKERFLEDYKRLLQLKFYERKFEWLSKV